MMTTQRRAYLLSLLSGAAAAAVQYAFQAYQGAGQGPVLWLPVLGVALAGGRLFLLSALLHLKLPSPAQAALIAALTAALGQAERTAPGGRPPAPGAAPEQR